jgi:pimeloyl-ACP methyl ester carboxylesterase
VHAPRFHERPAAGRLPIHLARLRAAARRPEPDPLFLLAGGPGQGARSYAAIVPRAFGDVRRTRDVILVDLRGTGASNPLDCPTPGGDVGALADCRAHLPADLAPFTTERQVRDLDLVREALGYARVNLWGGSFGTRSAPAYTRLFPTRVRSVVLDGAFPFEHVFPRATAEDSAAALEEAFATCTRDAACVAAYPHLRRDLDDLLSTLTRAPLRVSAPDPATGAPTTVTLDRGTLAAAVKVMLYTPKLTRVLPLALARLKQGDPGPLLAAAAAGRSWSTDTMALGLTARLLCAEDLPRLTGEPAAGTFVGRSDVDAWRAICRGFEADVPADLAARPLPVPALILSGALDPVTPPRWGVAMRAHFPRSTHLVVADGAHNVSLGGCMPDVIARFIANADPASVDAGPCATRHGGHGFVVNAAAARP